MDAKEILTRLKDGTLDKATAAALLRRAMASEAPAAAPVGRGGSVTREQAEALLRAAAAGSNAATAVGHRPAEPPAPGMAADKSGPAPGMSPQGPAQEPIAVIGYSARFPGAEDADTFWERVLAGHDLVTEVPQERWPIAEHYDPDLEAEGKSVSKWGAFVDDVDRFDAEFFRMTPREAELTDPQARLCLQEAWRALEHAGLRAGELSGARCGVHVGVTMNGSNSLLASRIAYHLDLKGPAVTVDTACSSSLVALHQACQTLWLGEADLMLVGGVTLYLTELPHVFMSRAGMLSPSGRCRPFDAAADGIVPGEGCVVVVLKPLSRALADGDPVHAVVRAGGLNQDGRTKGSTAHSAASQARLVGDTLDRFGLDPSGIDYVECHGTGTPLGDPIEVTALNQVFAPAVPTPGSIPIGSVKGNIGHTSAAAGLAGLLKAIGVVRTGQVPPSLHCTPGTLNPAIPFAEGPFTVATERRTLPDTGGRPRRASVSSFGFSGTNAYVVIEQAPMEASAVTVPAAPGTPVLVPLSERRPGAAADRAAELARWLRSPAGADAALIDLAHTLSCARDHHPHRVALIVADRSQLLDSLDLLVSGEPDSRRVAGPDTPLTDPADRRARAALLGPLTDRIADRMGAAEAPEGATPEAELRELARLYMEGHRVDWPRIYPPSQRRRISAPGYAFARDRHDVVPETQAAPGAPGDPATGTAAHGSNDPGDPINSLVLYTPGWHDTSLPTASRRPAADPSEPYAPAAAPADAAPFPRLARVVAAETGLDAGRLDAGQDLFALGANHRQLVRIAARIAADGGSELSLETLLTAADLGALADAAYPDRADHSVPAHA